MIVPPGSSAPDRAGGPVVVVVPVPAGEREWLVSLGDHGGEPAIVHAIREAASLGARTVVVCDAESVPSLRSVLDGAGLPAVEVTARPPSAVSLGRAAGLPAGATVLVHDPLCPLTPRAFLAKALAEGRPGQGSDEESREGSDWGPDFRGAPSAVVAVRPMTDTVKVVREGQVTGTVDRTGLRVLASPVVLPPGLADRLPETGDVPALVEVLRQEAAVRLLPAPTLARRVADRTGLEIALALRDLEERDR